MPRSTATLSIALLMTLLAGLGLGFAISSILAEPSVNRPDRGAADASAGDDDRAAGDANANANEAAGEGSAARTASESGDASSDDTGSDADASDAGATNGSAEGSAATPDVVALQDALAEAEQEKADLAARVAELEEELASTKQAAGEPAFLFGPAGELDGVRSANWRILASTNVELQQAIRDLRQHQANGEQPPRQLMLRMQQLTERMRTYEFDVFDQMPSAGVQNRELTHPITMVNLLYYMLEEAGEPMTESQQSRAQSLGETFSQEFAAQRSRYTDQTLRTKRIADEYQLKGRFRDNLFALLTPVQLDVVVDPSTHKIAGSDLFDPSLLLIHTTQYITGTTQDELTTNLVAAMAQRWSLEEEQQQAIAPLLDQWLADVASILREVPQSQVGRWTYEEGLRGIQATARLMESVRNLPAITPETAQAITNDPTMFMPRLIAA